MGVTEALTPRELQLDAEISGRFWSSNNNNGVGRSAKVAELADYSGKFMENFRYEDFSREALFKLVKEYARVYVGYMGMWTTVTRERMGIEESYKLFNEVLVRTVRQFEAPGIMKALNIYGNDVITLIKLMQAIPDGSGDDIYPSTYDIKNNNHVIFTVKMCPTLLFYEKRGDHKGIEFCCGVGGLEEVTIIEYAKFVNPDIKITALKVPPRKSKDDIACQWEIKLEPKT